MRKFEILNVELSPGGPGPDRLYRIHYRAIRDKVWVESTLHIIARNAPEARQKAEQRFGGRK